MADRLNDQEPAFGLIRPARTICRGHRNDRSDVMRPATRSVGMLATPLAKGTQAALRGQSLTIIGWHRLGEAGDGLTTTFADFVRHLDTIERWGAAVLPLPEARRLLQRGGLPPRAVALTFDDGYASVLEQAWPELRRRRLPATLFAVSGYLGEGRAFPWDRHHTPDSELIRVASREALIEAADKGLDIGSHTVTHRWLPGLSDRDVAYEVSKSRTDLEDLLGRNIESFAYPMGGWTPGIRAQVEKAGYDYAITAERGSNRATQDQHALRRAFAFDRPSDLRRQLNGAYTWMRPIETRRSRKAPL